MTRRVIALASLFAMALSVASVRADLPVPEAGVISPQAGKVITGECKSESVFDIDYDDPAIRPAAIKNSCQRLKIVFGPIWAKPGQNDVLIQPVTYEKPLYDGYMVRFKPDLVGVDPLSSGFDANVAAPPVEDLHLHHGTWLNPSAFNDFGSGEFISTPAGNVPNPGRRYGWGPWLASGEEKTIASWPEGFGLKIKSTDAWLFLHMVHNATPRTFPVWVTYDVDYIPADVAEAPHPEDPERPLLFKTKGIWLDVGDCSHWTTTGCQKDQFNPVFNIQRGFGIDGVCVFPRQNCAYQNTLANKSAQQGIDKGTVYDQWEIPEDGTLVVMGGHLHNGGLRDDVYLVRDGVEKLIHRSDAFYFDHDFDPATWNEAVDPFDRTKSEIGAPPTSWDFVMSGVSDDLGWRVEVKKGDKLRLEGVYDSSIASWYEQMGIVMTWLAPNSVTTIDGVDRVVGIDPFASGVEIHDGVNTLAVQPGTRPELIPGYEHGPCMPSATRLCTRGQITHARVATSGNHTDPCLNGCPDIARTAPDGDFTSDIYMAAFGYGNADFGVIGALGVPRVKVGDTIAFHNVDTADYMWHTATRCANPCSGTVVTHYPIADGAYDDLIDPSTGTTANGKTVGDLLAENGADPLDFDSGALGVGTGAVNKVTWSWTPTRPGTYTFWCRIHPSMRGAVRVVE